MSLYFPSLSVALDNLSVDNLKKLLQYVPGKAPKRKADIIDAIASQLEGEALRSQWSQLDDIQQNAVREAAYAEDGHLSIDGFAAKYRKIPDWGESSSFFLGRLYITDPSRLGLFLYSKSVPFLGTEIPADLQKRIRAFVEPPPPVTLKTLEKVSDTWPVLWETYDLDTRGSIWHEQFVPLTVRETERVAPQELQAFLRAVQLGKLSVSEKTSMPGKSSLRQASELLVGGDFYDNIEGHRESQWTPATFEEMRAFAWVMLLQGGNLVQLEGKKLQLTTAGQKALGDDPAKTLKNTWKKWMKTTLFDEMRRFRLIKGQTGKAQRSMTAPRKRREVIQQVLCQCPVEEWIEVEELVRYCVAAGEIFDVSRAPETLNFSDLGFSVDFYDTVGQWTALETSYLQCFLFEYAATLGAIDVAYINPFVEPTPECRGMRRPQVELSQYEGLMAFRINGLGAYLLGMRSQYEARPVVAESTLRVLPNLEIVLAGPPLNPTESLLLETYTEQTSDMVWKLDRGKLLAAVDSGQSLDDFRNFLRRASAGEIPATVEQLFEDISQRSQQLTDLGLVRYLECADATLATQIANDSRTKKYCHLAGDRHLVIPQDLETRFRSALRKLGYTLPLNRS